MGAYTVAASSTFNGFQKPDLHYIMSRPAWWVLSDIWSVVAQWSPLGVNVCPHYRFTGNLHSRSPRERAHLQRSRAFSRQWDVAEKAAWICRWSPAKLTWFKCVIASSLALKITCIKLQGQFFEFVFKSDFKFLCGSWINLEHMRLNYFPHFCVPHQPLVVFFL